jgi:hypothetical protein
VATCSIDIDAHAEAVWSVITDPTTYPSWLVGTRRIFHVDPDFPARGSRFDHEVGVGPLRVRDHSTVLEAHARGRGLVLQVRARPVIGSARVEMTVLTAGVGCARVTIREQPRALPLGRLLRPLADRMIKARNARSLANLRGLLETPDALFEAPPADATDRAAPGTDRQRAAARRAPRRRRAAGPTRAIA